MSFARLCHESNDREAELRRLYDMLTHPKTLQMARELDRLAEEAQESGNAGGLFGKPYHLSQTERAILEHLRSIGRNQTTSQIVEALDYSDGTVSGPLARLKRDGLLVNERAGREKGYGITPRGEKILRQNAGRP